MPQLHVIGRHIFQGDPGHPINLDNMQILDNQSDWFKREVVVVVVLGLKEAIYIRTVKLSLNKGGGRYQLPSGWDNFLG